MNFAAIKFEQPRTWEIVIGRASTRRRAVAHRRTGTAERFLLSLTIFIMPLQDHFPSMGGFSIMWVLFAALAGYTFAFRLSCLSKVWLHPVFISGYVLLASGCLIESAHPYSQITELFRMAQMIVGAVFMSALLRDVKALKACLYSFLGVGLAVSALLIGTGYRGLSSASTTDFGEATEMRNAAFADNPIQNSPNTLAFYTSQGVVVALALALTARSARRRKFFLACLLFSTLGTLLPMSRGGVAIMILSAIAVLFAYGIRNIKTILSVTVVSAAVMFIVPDVVFSRLKLTTHFESGKQEARVRIYTAAIDHFPEYFVTGVGSGNFWGPWGLKSSFAKRGDVAGAHNGLIQITLYWGVVGLATLLALIVQAYRCLPKGNKNGLALAIYGIAASAVMFLQVHHVLSAKQFALALGLVVGTHYWVLPHFGEAVGRRRIWRRT